MARLDTVELNQLIGGLLGTKAPSGNDSIPWADIRSFATPNVVPMLGHRVRKLGMPVPSAIETWLEDAQRAAAVRHVAQSHVVTSLSGRLGIAKVPHVWLKGAAAARLVYPSPELRPMQDLDLWVRPTECDIAEEALTQVGLVQVDSMALGSSSDPQDRQFVTVGPVRVVVELHELPASLAAIPGTLLHTMFDRRIPIPNLPHGSALAPEDMILHTCLHMARHHRFSPGLLPLLDLRLLLERWRDSIPWDDWVAVAQTVGAASVWLPLELAHRYVNAPVPKEVRTTLAPRGSETELVTMAERQLVSAQEFPAGLESLFGGWADFRDWVSRAVATSSTTDDRGVRQVLTRKVAEYRQRVAIGQLPRTGWVAAIRRARGRSRLRRLLHTCDQDQRLE